MASSLIPPIVLRAPFAVDGNRNDIPENPPSEDSALASLSLGFPPKTTIPIPQGGVPPNAADFNGLGYTFTSQQFFQQNGGVFTFDAAVSTAIGGYPIEARLWGKTTDGKGFIVRSLKANNTDNFVTQPAYIGYVGGPTTNTVGGIVYQVSWVYDIITQQYADQTYANQTLSNVAVPPYAYNGNTVVTRDYVMRQFYNENWGTVNGSQIALGWELWRSGKIEYYGKIFGTQYDQQEWRIVLPQPQMNIFLTSYVSCNTASNGTDTDSGFAGLRYFNENNTTVVIVRLGRRTSRTTVSQLDWSITGVRSQVAAP